MSTKIFLLGGTEDGRKLGEMLSCEGFDVTVSVVSDYGRQLIETCAAVKVNAKALDKEELTAILVDEKFDCVVDASHPYAKNVSSNAIEAAACAGIDYIRYERAEIELTYDKIILVDSYEEAAEKSAALGENIFLTTGSRNLKVFTESAAMIGKKLTVRVLPTAEVIAECEALGLSPKQIIAIQGAFSVELNAEMFKHAKADVIVTKNSGRIGGADTKLEAAKLLNLPVVMINRPKIQYPNLATTFEEVLKFLTERK
ncbi:MAG: precorrin-6A reductase [Selenomonadaceae bacterium]|nr:precorrin-6A reductase [Selenomonadaceae bacterium]